MKRSLLITVGCCLFASVALAQNSARRQQRAVGAGIRE